MMNERLFVKDFVGKEIIGPANYNVADDGQELLFYDKPTDRYISGILFPQNINVDDKHDEETHASALDNVADSGEGDDIAENFADYSLSQEDTEEWLNLSNAFKQSAISLTICVRENETFDVVVDAAIYVREKNDETVKNMGGFAYHRKPIHYVLFSKEYALPGMGRQYSGCVLHDGKKSGLELHIFYRYKQKNDSVYTITLENTNKKGDGADDLLSFFQVKMTLSSETGFCEIFEPFKTKHDEDYRLNKLLYRNVKKYALGHGCSPLWNVDENLIHEINSEFMPSFESKSIVPSKISNVDFSMYNLSTKSKRSKENTCNELRKMCYEYSKWIDLIEKEAEFIEKPNLQLTAKENVKLCRECNQRILNGINKLETDENTYKAFCLMNEAMLLQQMHHSIKPRIWKTDEPELSDKGTFVFPEIDNQETWCKNDRAVYGVWRPFQLAFILLNIFSISNPLSDEHKNIELIWFPTGGGKTEAYLGLSSFTIFYNRLLNKKDKGTDIIMRYTLRLLTSQQYERAAALICACDYIRSQHEETLGKNEISIGLWVGGETTPNKHEDALILRRDLYSGKEYNINPFVITKCPWCGAEMGILSTTDGKDPKINKIRGYQRDKIAKKFYFQCENSECHFSHTHGHRLPLYLIDEDIYENPPSMLIGTVDKFAMLPFLPKANSVFGLDKNGERIKIPSLIIQDELHLISGPLGSTVGLYETMIDYLCTDKRTSHQILRPKIIASTATISMAKEQCHNLYGCTHEQVKIFPSSGINAGESFFAHVENTNNLPGRLYVGLYMPGSSSPSTAAIHVLSSILQSATRIQSSARDPYWTNVVYFNSLKELGQAETWINADITEYSKTINKRIDDGMNRYVNKHIELTSRIDGHRVTDYLNELNNAEKPIDICLATNMISVGLDVSRLGLMTVMGQPKTSSEYIQATSRVGRGKYPGIVFTIFSPSKPRDKSIFECFLSFHSKMYTYVEPTSVTPFSPQLRDRALAAIFFGMVRLNSSEAFFDKPQEILANQEDRILEVSSAIIDRVNAIDDNEKENTKVQIKQILKRWKSQNPIRYCYPFSLRNDYTDYTELPCFFPKTFVVNDDWNISSNSIPTSMRNVDKECCIQISDEEDD